MLWWRIGLVVSGEVLLDGGDRVRGCAIAELSVSRLTRYIESDELLPGVCIVDLLGRGIL